MTVTQIAVPVTLAAILSYVFQFLKPLLEMIPGMRPTDASHDTTLRFVYGALVFLSVGEYQIYTAGAPATLDGWLTLVLSLITTAATMAVAAHYNYQVMTSASAPAPVVASIPPTPITPAPVPAVASDPAFPPGVPLETLQSQLAPAA